MIFGGTFWHFANKLSLVDLQHLDKGPRYVVKNGKLFIEAYHPSQTTVSKESYVNGIVDVIRNFAM